MMPTTPGSAFSPRAIAASSDGMPSSLAAMRLNAISPADGVMCCDRKNSHLRASARPAGVLASTNTILHERQLEEYYCTLCYAFFDFKRQTVTISNSGLPYPIHCSGDQCGQIELPGVPLGSFSGVTYDEATVPGSPCGGDG